MLDASLQGERRTAAESAFLSLKPRAELSPLAPAAGTCSEPFNVTPMGVNSTSPAHLRVRTTGRTCRRAGEIKEYTHPKNCTLFFFQLRAAPVWVAAARPVSRPRPLRGHSRARARSGSTSAARKTTSWRCGRGRTTRPRSRGRWHGRGASSSGWGTGSRSPGTTREPFSSTPVGVNSISFGSPHARPTGAHRTCDEPDEINQKPTRKRSPLFV